jgi:hypothetical protein
MSHKKFRFFKIMIQSVFYYYRKWGFILFWINFILME